MAQILVRKIDDHAMERLRLIARDRRKSVEGLVREAIEREAQQSTDEEFHQWLADLDELRKQFPKSDEDSTVILRALRDGDETDD